MCGRYYVNDETAREIEAVIRQADQKLSNKIFGNSSFLAREIHPTDIAPVIVPNGQKLSCRTQRWGFSGFTDKQVIFNARSESVLEKRMFRESTLHRRIVVPASWFYEWNQRKEKNIFSSKEQPVIFMAGIYNYDQEEERFVILTTAANESMKPVHDRMPLILEKEEILPWIFNDKKAEQMLHKIPCLLERKTDFEQMTLF